MVSLVFLVTVVLMVEVVLMMAMVAVVCATVVIVVMLAVAFVMLVMLVVLVMLVMMLLAPLVLLVTMIPVAMPGSFPTELFFTIVTVIVILLDLVERLACVFRWGLQLSLTKRQRLLLVSLGLLSARAPDHGGLPERQRSPQHLTAERLPGLSDPRTKPPSLRSPGPCWSTVRSS